MPLTIGQPTEAKGSTEGPASLDAFNQSSIDALSALTGANL